ncbi:MAG: leucine-rich repeat domain-containing protein, partial [Clostridia bacterium]|nr:leucine-rich repeat domain-containing protein [Clostridia bacterium]
MKMIFKKSCLLLALMIMVMLFTVSVYAKGQEDFIFKELNNNSIEITKYVGADTEIYIPSEINGKTVASIGSYAFRDCTNIEKVILPDSIINLGKNIFSGCVKLTNINIPKNLKTCLYDHSVSSYTNSFGAIIYKHYYYGPFADSSIINVVIPEGLSHIPEYTFYGCTSIEKIVLPISIKSIGSYAFYSTNKLKSVYYTGTDNDFAEMQISSNNMKLLNAEWYMNHNHIYSSSILIQPTCTSDGKTQYNCDCSISYIEINKATGHNYEEEITVNATCKEEGLKTYSCFCGDTYTEKINKLSEHNYTAVATESTCSTEGFTTYTCICGDSYTDNYQPVKSHSYTTYTLYKSETCDNDRMLRSYCDYNCGKGIVVRVENTQLHHNYTTISSGLDATCIENGFTET